MAEHDFLVKIRETEKQAADLVEQALSQARQMQDDAREEAAALVNEGREAAMREQRDSLAAAGREADQMTADSDQATEREIQALKDRSAVRLTVAAAQIADRIVSDYGCC